MWTEADKHYFKINDLNINNHSICKYRDPLKNYILQRLKEFQNLDIIRTLRILRPFDPQKNTD